MKPKLDYYSFKQAAEYLSTNTEDDFSASDIESLVAQGFFVTGYVGASGYVFLSSSNYAQIVRVGSVSQIVAYKTREQVLYGVHDEMIFGSGCDATSKDDLSILRIELDDFIEKGERFDNRRTLYEAMRKNLADLRIGRKKEYIPKEINFILVEVGGVDNEFNRNAIPGVVNDFLDFCKLFSVSFNISKDTFHDYAKTLKEEHKNNGRPDYGCSWVEGNPASNPKYWADIKERLKTEKLNSPF